MWEVSNLGALWRTSEHDREILRLALPALGSLAAEPLYVLADTAIVGHLGRHQLAALGIAATVLSVLGLFNFLAYGTTAHVARATVAGERGAAAAVGAQALWLSLALVYGLDLGIRGSAWGTAAAQSVMGVLFLAAILRAHGDRRLRPALARRLLGLGGHIFVRTAALLAAFVLAGVAVARFGTASL